MDLIGFYLLIWSIAAFKIRFYVTFQVLENSFIPEPFFQSVEICHLTVSCKIKGVEFGGSVMYNFLQSHAEKAMVPHSSTPAWKIPWMEEPGRLQSMGSLRVGHYCAASLSLFTFMHWRRKWQPTPVFLPGEPQGRVGCRLWGRTESDTTEAT